MEFVSAVVVFYCLEYIGGWYVGPISQQISCLSLMKYGTLKIWLLPPICLNQLHFLREFYMHSSLVILYVKSTEFQI